MKQNPLFGGKSCKQCHEWKEITEYHRDRKCTDGRRDICKVCVKSYQESLRRNPSPRKPAAVGEKKCSACKVTKPRSEFSLRANKKYLRSRCRICETEITGKFLKAHPELVHRLNRKATLKRHYGMTPEDYERMYTKQRGLCAACGRPKGPGYRYLFVDHNHKTGAVRGLLCRDCNSAIGYLRDDPVRALKIAEYLDRYSKIPIAKVEFFAIRQKKEISA